MLNPSCAFDARSVSRRLWLLATFTAAFTTLACGEEQAQVRFNELQPPSAEDWLRWRIAEKSHGTNGGCTTCGMTPLPVYRSITYYPQSSCDPCNSTGHASFRGTYGTVHPMPYYIEEPTISPAGRRWDKRSPEHPSLLISPPQPRPMEVQLFPIEAVPLGDAAPEPAGQPSPSVPKA